MGSPRIVVRVANIPFWVTHTQHPSQALLPGKHTAEKKSKGDWWMEYIPYPYHYVTYYYTSPSCVLYVVFQ